MTSDKSKARAETALAAFKRMEEAGPAALSGNELAEACLQAAAGNEAFADTLVTTLEFRRKTANPVHAAIIDAALARITALM